MTNKGIEPTLYGAFERVSQYLEDGKVDEAAAQFGNFHYSDQGDLLMLLEPDVREKLLDSLSTNETARVMEFL